MLKYVKHIPPLIFEHRLTELTFFTTDICNMKCRHCFVLDALNHRLPHLSVEEIGLMAQHIPAMQRVHLGGGEPFTRSDLPELAVKVSNEWNAGVVCVPTNGWFTDRIIQGIEHFGQYGRGNLRLHFSINSPEADDMDQFTRLKGSFLHWRRSIDEALSLSKKYPHITIVALATYNEFNQNRFIELIDFLHQEVGIDDFSFQLVRTHGNYAPKLDIDGFRKATEYYFSRYNRQNRLLAAFRQETRNRSADYFQEPHFEHRCTSGKTRVVMSPTGDIYPCEKLGYPNLARMADVHMGNVREFDYNIVALLASDRAKQVYEHLCANNCHCDHNIDQSLSLLSTKSFRNKVLKRALAL